MLMNVRGAVMVLFFGNKNTNLSHNARATFISNPLATLCVHRGTSLIGKRPLAGPYRRHT